MKKMMLLLAFSVVLVGFHHIEKAHAGEMPCGSYGLSASDPCVPNGDQICQEWVYDSNGDVVPGSSQCVTSTPVGGVKRWTSASGQSCEQEVNADGSPEYPATCAWPTKTESVGDGCSELIFTAGPQTGQPVGPAWCPSPPTPDTTHLKTWINP